MILTLRRHFYQECLNFRVCVCVIKKSDDLFLYIVENEIILEILKHLVIRNLSENVALYIDHHTFQLLSTYSQTCIKRSLLGQRINGLIRQVTL